MIETLYQEEVWTTNDGETLSIADMNSRHIKNVLNWLWRNRESLKMSAESSMAFGGPTPSGDAASDAFDAAFEALLQQGVNDWVRNLPICRAMAKVLETRGERQEFWLPA